MKRIFIAATKQNDGKTTVSLGLIFAFKKIFKGLGFIKPIGQRYLEEEGIKVDEDSVLIEKICRIESGLRDMSPVAVERGFTEKYIQQPKGEEITRHIKQSFQRASKNKDLMIIEGTGHAGVGAVFEHSNAKVAKLLDSKVILVSSGGIGRPIDEIVLNKALFDAHNVELMGVIINKVLKEKYEKVNRLVRMGLERRGIDVLGVIPYYPCLSAPTMEQIQSECDFEFLSGEENMHNLVKRILVGAMEPHNALDYIEGGSLVITPGDREDIILATLSVYLAKEAKAGGKIAGIILSGGIFPHTAIMKLVKNTKIPLLLAREDTYKVASRIHDLSVKIRPTDKEKVEQVANLVCDYVDVKNILNRI